MAPLLLTSSVLLLLFFHICGHATPVLEERQSQSNLPAGWVPFGCFSDIPASRTLKIASFSDVTNMTIESCIAFCAPSGFKFSGVEFSRECFCDNVIEPPGAQIADSTCNMPCTGNSGEICGGSGAISIFQNTAGPKIKQQANTYQYVGCYQDGVNGAPRSLRNQLSITGGNSAETCTAACKAAGFVLAGLEFGQECWCDNYFPSPVLVPDTDCNIVCTGDNTELCGAGNRLAIYEDTSVPALGINQCLTCSQLRAGTTSGMSTFNLTAQPMATAAVPIATPTSLAPTQLAAFEQAAIIEQPTMQLLEPFTGQQRLHTFGMPCDDGTHGRTFVFQSIDTTSSGTAVFPTAGGPLQLAEHDSGTFVPAPNFCAMTNGFSKSTFIGPPLLGINELSNQWGLCSGRVTFAFEDASTLCIPIVLELTL